MSDLTVKLVDAAKAARIPVSTVRDWVYKGWLPATLDKRALYIDQDDFDDLAAKYQDATPTTRPAVD